MTRIYLVVTGAVLLYMTGWFIAAQIRGRNDIADVAWGLGSSWRQRYRWSPAVSTRRAACWSPGWC